MPKDAPAAEPPPPPGASADLPVVAILGDSITAGYGLPAREALPAQLEAAMAAAGTPVRVRAAGLEGIEMAGPSGMAKQRLQQLLDSGRVSIEPLGMDGGDVTLARVRVDGRDVSELVSAR